MAKTPVSDEELQLKKKARRRLVGAVVLVLLVVVFVPMFLDREPRSQKQDIDIRIPAIPGQTQAPQPSVLPPPAQDASAPPPPAATAPKPSNPPKEPAVSAPAASDNNTPPGPPPTATVEPEPKAAEPADKPARKPPESARKAETPAAESFVIQVGAFSDPGNARHLVEKLKAEKIPAYTEAVKTSQGEKMRVRAGPYPTIAAAERGRTRLKTLKLLPGGDAKIVHKGE